MSGNIICFSFFLKQVYFFSRCADVLVDNNSCHIPISAAIHTQRIKTHMPTSKFWILIMLSCFSINLKKNVEAGLQ